MESKEKAKDILEKINGGKISKERWKNASNSTKETIKQLALIVVKEIESALTEYGKGDSMELQNMDSEFRYWDKVKQEIKSF